MKTHISLPIVLLFTLAFINGYAQEGNPLFSRLQAISNSGLDFFNIDGIEITSQPLAGEFSKKNIAKKFKKYSIKEADLNQSDTSISNQNFYIQKTEEIATGVVRNTSYYFVETSHGIKAITFGSINKTDKELEREMVHLIATNGIPQTLFEQTYIVDSINFAGRKLSLGRSCQWMGINNVQCPYSGQMNWSIHKTLQDASASTENQYKVIQAKKQGKIVSEEEVNVVFEGSEVKAKKVIYDFKGVTSLLAGMSGGKTLTIYFVAAPVRQNFVSCVMSFWNNDNIHPSGLPLLLEQVMQLKN
jgi:hypothetical protein